VSYFSDILLKREAEIQQNTQAYDLLYLAWASLTGVEVKDTRQEDPRTEAWN
jgi:hypothetical protein